MTDSFRVPTKWLQTNERSSSQVKKMDAKTIFQPKIWYIIAGAMALIGGIENY